jgi:hypothetical protein
MDWATQNWSRGNLKNGIFFYGPPTSGWDMVGIMVELSMGLYCHDQVMVIIML